MPIFIFVLFFSLIGHSYEVPGPIYLDGERGQFFQRIYEKDKKYKDLLTSDINKANFVMLFQPTRVEAQAAIKKIKNNETRILFIFYDKVPSDFESLPCRTLSGRMKWIEDVISRPISSTPFRNVHYPDKVKFAVLLEAWSEFAEVYFRYDSKQVWMVAKLMGIPR